MGSYCHHFAVFYSFLRILTKKKKNQSAWSKSYRYFSNYKYLKVYHPPLFHRALDKYDWKRLIFCLLISCTWKIFSPWVTISACHSSLLGQAGAAPAKSQPLLLKGQDKERHPQQGSPVEQGGNSFGKWYCELNKSCEKTQSISKLKVRKGSRPFFVLQDN